MSGKELMQQQGLLGTNEAFFLLVFPCCLSLCVRATQQTELHFSFNLVTPDSSAFTQAFRGTRLN